MPLSTVVTLVNVFARAPDNASTPPASLVSAPAPLIPPLSSSCPPSSTATRAWFKSTMSPAHEFVTPPALFTAIPLGVLLFNVSGSAPMLRGPSRVSIALPAICTPPLVVPVAKSSSRRNSPPMTSTLPVNELEFASVIEPLPFFDKPPFDRRAPTYRSGMMPPAGTENARLGLLKSTLPKISAGRFVPEVAFNVLNKLSTPAPVSMRPPVMLMPPTASLTPFRSSRPLSLMTMLTESSNCPPK